MIVTTQYKDYLQVEAIGFYSDLQHCLSTFPKAELHLEKHIDNLDSSINALQPAFMQNTQSAYTAQLVIEDEVRDDIVKTCVSFATAFANHYTQSLAESGKRILSVFTRHGSLVHRKSYPVETQLLKSIYNELTSDEILVQDLATCGMTQMIEDMNSANLTFETTYRNRQEEGGKPEEIKIAELITLANNNCRKLLKQIEACVLVYEEVDYSSLINKINAIIEEYNDIASRRLNQGSKTSTQTEE